MFGTFVINLVILVLAVIYGLKTLVWAFTDSGGWGVASAVLFFFVAVCGFNVYHYLSGGASKDMDDAIREQMGYMTSCRVCGKDMSSKAFGCPHCGHPNPRQS